MGNVCQYYGHSNTISDSTGEKICQNAGFDSMEKVDYIRDGAYSSYSKYKFIRDYSSKLYNLVWSVSYNRFTYSTSSSCSGSYGYYYTFISCQCGADFYNSTTGCMKCPEGSTSPVHSPICHCPAGTHWTQGYCKPCPNNTYSLANSTECTECPLGSYSRSGSEVCLCGDGLYMSEEGLCTACGNGNYSYSQSNYCTICPEGSSAGLYQGFCTCPAGQKWEFHLPIEKLEHRYQEEPIDHLWPVNGGLLPGEQAGFCADCVPGNYSKVNSTQCTKCPDHSTSPSYSSRCYCEPGFKWVEQNHTSNNHTVSNHTVSNHTVSNHTVSNHTTHNQSITTLHDFCEICPENHYSQFGALNCTQCPHFKAATPGSEYCYRCTLGEYWENHTCVQCPDHLYGDGVHCNKCPEGFKVLHGFCYWSGDDGEVVVAERAVGMNKVVESSSASYFGAVLTSVLLFFGYSKRDVLKQLLKGLTCKLSVKGTVQEGIQVDVGFNDLRGRVGEREVVNEDEGDSTEDEDCCCDTSPAAQIGENLYSEQIYEDI